MKVIRELVEIVEIHELDTEVLAASIRHPRHMTEAALAGAHIATLPFKVLQQMVHHPLTDKGIVQFRADWEKAREALPRGDERAKEASSRRHRPSPAPRGSVQAVEPLAAAHHALDAELVVELDEVGPLADGDPAAIVTARASPAGCGSPPRRPPGADA